MNSKANMEEGQKPTREKARKIRPRMIGWLIILFVAWLAVVQVLAADRYQAVVRVVPGEQRVGVNPTTERLDFGDLSRQSSARRVVTVTNDGGIPTRILVFAIGELGDLMRIDPDGFRLKAGDNQEISFTVRIPSSAEDRVYKARVIVLRLPFL